MKKLISIIKKVKMKFYCLITLGTLFLSKNIFASSGDNPFPKIDINDGDVVSAVGTHMEASMKYAMVGGGIIMLLVGIGVIMHRLREDSATKETGSFLTTLIIAGLAITVGIILIAIGWSAAGYQA